MRITIHIPDSLVRDAKIMAEALSYHMTEKKKKRLGRKVLEMASKIREPP